ncbi:hypothetical protein Misp01_38790 [Microtetraspora sp. NBRC 13810]|nr:hypothetical protein Misp01_38790 [Microtetraspora sp. NBRC 13810]
MAAMTTSAQLSPHPQATGTAAASAANGTSTNTHNAITAATGLCPSMSGAGTVLASAEVIPAAFLMERGCAFALHGNRVRLPVPEAATPSATFRDAK